MTHQDEFTKRAEQTENQIDFYLFGWVDGTGNKGDYGLNEPPIEKTLQTLITTTYMFQSEPKFTLVCRRIPMCHAQFAYLQDNDLDTEEFLLTLFPLPAPAFELDLSQFGDAASALEAMHKICA